MPPLYFEASTGKLHEIPDEQFHERPLPNHVLPLAQLLVANEFPFAPGDYPRLRLSDWSYDQGLRAGRKIHEDLSRLDPPQTFTGEIVARSHTLGIFPDFNFIRKNYGSLKGFADKIGAPSTKNNNLNNAAYNLLPDSELAAQINRNYRSQLEQFSPYDLTPPLNSDIIKSLHDMALSPSLSYFHRRDLSIGTLNELNGHTLPKWTGEPISSFGANVLFYNSPRALTIENCIALHDAGLGPDITRILHASNGSWRQFTASAYQAYSSGVALTKQHRAVVYDYYDLHVDEGRPHLINRMSDYTEKAAYYGLSRLLRLHGLPRDRLVLPARVPPSTRNRVVSYILQASHVDIRRLADSAQQIEVFEDIWPTAIEIGRMPILANPKVRV